jgi:hypothetical protein
MKNLNKFKGIKNKHIVISETNYHKLKKLGKMGDTFDKVLGELLLKNQMLESDSRVGTREETLTNSLTPLFNGDDKP